MKKSIVVIFTLMFFVGSIRAQAIMKKQEARVPMQLNRITVQSPNGGEVWFEGKAYQVRWTEFGKIGDVRHVLFVYPSGPEWVLGTVKAEKKHLKYFYQILPKFAGHEKYKVRVTTLDGKVKDESDAPFYIRSQKLTSSHRMEPGSVKYSVKPFIRITHPAEGFVFRLPQKAKVKVELSSKSMVLLHIHKPGHSGVYRARFIRESELRQTRQGFFVGVLKIDLNAGKYHVIVAPQTHLENFGIINAGPVNFKVAPPPMPMQKR